MFDVRMALIGYAPLGLLIGVLLVALWWSGGRRSFQLFWGIFAFLGSVTALLLSLRGVLPDVVVVLGGNLANIAAWGFFWQGARSLRGARVSPLGLILPPALWPLAALLLPGFMASPPLRVAVFTVIVVALTVLATLELRHVRRQYPQRLSIRLLLTAVVTYCAVLAIRPGLLALAWREPADAVTILLAGLLFLAVGFAGVLIVNEEATARDAAALAAAEAREQRLRAELAEREADMQRRVRGEIDRLVGTMPVGVFLRSVTPDGEYRNVYASGAIELVTGWPREVIGDAARLNALQEPGTASRQTLMRDALRNGVAVQDWRLRQPDGSWRWMRTQVRRLSLEADGSGEVVGYVADITRERAAEAHATTTARLASLGEMATGLAHELRQPLTAISMAAENAEHYMQAGNLPALQQRLQKIVDQTERASAIIEHLRWFARGAAHGEAAQPVRLDTAVDGALILIGSGLEDIGAHLSRDLGTPPPMVMADPAALQQVLVVLLQNARDALAERPQGAPREVRILAVREAGCVRVEVADTGGGIAEAHLPRIFEPFFTTKGPDRGTGLGLSISHGLMRGMGGGIAAGNDAQGAVFTLTLRRAPEDDEPPPLPNVAE